MGHPVYIQGALEIVGQTLRAYSIHCKDEKKSYKHGFGNAFSHFSVITTT